MLDTSKITTEQYVLGAIAGFLLLFAIGTCGGSGGGAKDPEALAGKVVSAVAKKDRAAIDRLLISSDQLTDVVQKSTLPQEAKDESIAQMKKNMVDPAEEFNVRWESIYTRMNLDAFDHTQMKLVKVDAKEEERQGILGAEVIVEVESAGKPGLILFTGIKAKAWHLLPRVFFESKTGVQAH
jgi:hypothetical protein